MGLIRDYILDDSNRFKKLVSQLEKDELEFSQENVLTNMPRGYNQYADHDLAWALRMKDFAVKMPMSRDIWISDDIVDHILSFVRAATPILKFASIGVDKKT